MAGRMVQGQGLPQGATPPVTPQPAGAAPAAPPVAPVAEPIPGGQV